MIEIDKCMEPVYDKELATAALFSTRNTLEKLKTVIISVDKSLGKLPTQEKHFYSLANCKVSIYYKWSCKSR